MIFINRRNPSPPKMSKAKIDYFRDKERRRQEEEEEKLAEELEERRLYKETMDKRERLERTVGRHVVTSVTGNVNGPVHRYLASDIMKAFRCKEDFIKILTMEGRLVGCLVSISHSSSFYL